MEARRTRVAALLLALGCGGAAAQGTVPDIDVTHVATQVLSLMAFTITPDVTTSSLSVANVNTANPTINMTQFGGGFTVSRDVPLYLEGNAAYTRFDPKFVVTAGGETRTLPTKWNMATATGGVGWDFRVNEILALRPVGLLTFGSVASDVRAGIWWAERETDAELDFLDGGRLKAIGTGGSLMLDVEDYRPEREIDVELRYTNVRLRTRNDQPERLHTDATAENLNLWARLRRPTGWMLWERPVRSVLELAHSRFYGQQAGLIGFEQLTSLGVGLEADTSKFDTIVTRARAVLRYCRGDNVEGWSLGLAVSF